MDNMKYEDIPLVLEELNGGKETKNVLENSRNNRRVNRLVRRSVLDRTNKSGFIHKTFAYFLKPYKRKYHVHKPGTFRK